MTENIGAPSAPFNSGIPSLSDNADIQAALRYYHYGNDTNDPGSLLGDGTEDFIAGHLQTLENTKLGQTPTSLAASASLNDQTTTGFYVQANTPTGSNYPAAHAGMLTVVSDGTNVFQEYQVVGVAESGSASSTNKTWWRFYYGGSWKVWRTFVTSGEFVSLGDARYYTKSYLDSQFSSIPSTYLTISSAASTYLTISAADSRALITENEQTSDYTLQLSDQNKVVAMNNSSPATVTVPQNLAVAFPIGSVVNVYAMSNQTVTIAGDTDVTVRNAGDLFERDVEGSLRKRGTNEWVASGNIIPA